MGPGWRQRPRTFAPQVSVIATGVRDDVGYEYTCFMRGGEDACLHGRFRGSPLDFSDVESTAPLGVLLRHDLWTPFWCLISCKIISIILMVCDFTTKSDGIWFF